MKKYLLLWAAFLTSPLFAVVPKPPLNDGCWSIRSGVAISKLLSGSYATRSQTGFVVGAMYSKPLSSMTPFYFDTGLLFSKKGGEDRGYIGGYGKDYKITSYSIELPAELSFRMLFSPKCALSLSGGAFVGVALAGDVSYNNTSFDPYKDCVIKLRDSTSYSNERIFRRLDGGAKLGVGFICSRLTLDLNYNFGLVNLFAKSLRDQGFDLKSGGWDITLGFVI